MCACVYVFIILLPMSYSSIGTSFSPNNGMEGEFVGSKPIGCIIYPQKKMYL